MLSTKMFCHVALLLLSWSCIGSSSETELHVAVFDQEATASENIPRNHGFSRKLYTKVPAFEKLIRPADAISSHYESSDGFVPIKQQTRYYDHHRGSVDFVKGNKTGTTFKQVLNYGIPDEDLLEEDPVYSTEAKIFLDLTRQSPVRRSFKSDTDQSNFELLKVTNDTPLVANYLEFYENLQDNGKQKNAWGNVAEQPQPESRVVERGKNIKPKRRDRGRKMLSYTTNYGSNSGKPRQKPMDSENDYYSYSSLKESRSNSPTSLNNEEDSIDINFPIQDVINYQIQKESEPQHKIQPASKTNSDYIESSKSGLKSHSVQETSPNTRNRYRNLELASVPAQQGAQFNENSNQNPRNKVPKASVRTVSSDFTHRSHEHEINAQKELPKHDFMYEALFNREDSARSKYDSREEAKDLSGENFEYQDETERPKRIRKPKKRPKSIDVSQWLPKEHRETHEEMSVTVDRKKPRIIPGLKFHNHKSVSNAWVVQDEDESKEDDSSNKSYDATAEGTMSLGTKRQTFHDTSQLSNSWSQVSPNVEVSHSSGVPIDQAEKTNLVVPFKVNIVPVANFDHNTALGNSQGFDLSNAVIHNLVTANPVSSTASPIVNAWNAAKSSKNDQSHNLRYATAMPDAIMAQSTFQNPVQAILVPQLNFQSQNKLLPNWTPRYIQSTVSPVYISPVTASPNLQNANFNIIQHNVPAQNLQTVALPRSPLFESVQNSNLINGNLNGNQQQIGQSNLNAALPYPNKQTFQIYTQNHVQPTANLNVQLDSNGLRGQNLVHSENLYSPSNIVSTPAPPYSDNCSNTNLHASATQKNPVQPAANHHVQVDSNGLHGQNLLMNQNTFTPSNIVSTPVTPYFNQFSNVNLHASTTQRNPVQPVANHHAQANSNGLQGQDSIFYTPSNIVSVSVTPYSNHVSNANLHVSATQRNPVQPAANHNAQVNSNGLQGQNLALNENLYTSANIVSTSIPTYLNHIPNVNLHASANQRNPVQITANHNVELNSNGLHGQNMVFNENLYAPSNISPTPVTPYSNHVSNVNLHASGTQNNGNILPGLNGPFQHSLNHFVVDENIKKHFYNQNQAQSQNILQNIRPQLHNSFSQSFNDENLTPRTKELVRYAQSFPTVLNAGFNPNNVNYSNVNLNSLRLQEQSVPSPIAISQKYKEQNQQILKAANDIFENTLSQLKQLQRNQSIKAHKVTHQNYRGTDNTGSHSNLNTINVLSPNIGKISQAHLPNLGTRNVEITNPNIKPSPVDFTQTDLFRNLNNYAPSFFTTPIPILTSVGFQVSPTSTPIPMLTTAGYQDNLKSNFAPAMEAMRIQSYLDSLTNIETKAKNLKSSQLSDQKSIPHDLGSQGTLFNPISFIPNTELVKSQTVLNSKPISNEPLLMQNLNLVPVIPGGNFYRHPFFAENDLITKPKLSADLEKYAEEMFKESLKTIYNSQKWNHDLKIQPNHQQQNTSEIRDLSKAKDSLQNVKFMLPNIHKSKEVLEAHYTETGSRVTDPPKLFDDSFKPAAIFNGPGSLNKELQELFRHDFRVQSPVSTSPVNIHHTKANFDYGTSAILDSNRPTPGQGQNPGSPEYLDDFLTPPKLNAFLPKSPFNEMRPKKRPGISFGANSGSTNERPLKKPNAGMFNSGPGGLDASASSNSYLPTYFNNLRHESSQNKSQFERDNHDFGQGYQGLPSEFKGANFHNRYPSLTTSQPIADDYTRSYRDQPTPQSQQFDMNHPRMHNLLGLLRKNKQLPTGSLQNYFRDREELKQHFANEKDKLQAQFFGEALSNFKKKSDNSTASNMNTNSNLNRTKS